MKRLFYSTLLTGLSILNFVGVARAQAGAAIPAGQTVLTFVNRLIINPPLVEVVGYFTGLTGIPDSLFSGTPNETTAYFTWHLNAPGALQIHNGDAAETGSVSVAVLPPAESLNVYFNAIPNQTWSNLASFSDGQLIATFKSTPGTQTGSGPIALVTQSYLLESSHDFVFKGHTYNLGHLLPHGFTFFTLSSNIPLGGSPTPPLVFTAAGSGIAIGSALCGLPKFF